jgi:hypothetical protein
MRHLPLVTVGTYQIEAQAESIGGGVIEVTVRSADKFLIGRVAHQGKHDHTPEQFEKDINDFAARLAKELAGRIRSEELATNFAKG